MAASLTISAASLAADGKTLTLTIAGGSGALSPTNGLTGFKVLFDGSAVTISGSTATGNTTVTLLLMQFATSAATVTINLATTSNLTDASGNTPTGQTGVAVTN